MRPPIGIYKITNQKNGKVYVGQSQNVYERRKQHFNALKKNKHKNKMMQKDWKTDWKYFRWDLIELCNLEELNDKEIYWINKLNTMQPNGYNNGWTQYNRKKKKS